MLSAVAFAGIVGTILGLVVAKHRPRPTPAYAGNAEDIVQNPRAAMAWRRLCKPLIMLGSEGASLYFLVTMINESDSLDVADAYGDYANLTPAELTAAKDYGKDAGAFVTMIFLLYFSALYPCMLLR